MFETVSLLISNYRQDGIVQPDALAYNPLEQASLPFEMRQLSCTIIELEDPRGSFIFIMNENPISDNLMR